MTARLADLLADPEQVAEIVDALTVRAEQLKEAAARAAAELAGEDPAPVLAMLAAAGRLSLASKAFLAHPQPGTPATPSPPTYRHLTPPPPAARAADPPAQPVTYTAAGRPVYGIDPARLDGILAAADIPDDPAEAARAKVLDDLDREVDAINRATPTLHDIPRLPVDRRVLAARREAPDLDTPADPAAIAALGERLRTFTWPPTGPVADAATVARHNANVASVARHNDLPPRPDNPDVDTDTLAELDAFLSTEQPEQP